MKKKVIRLFKKYTPVYYWIRNSIAFIIINQGGTSSSKTISTLQDIIRHCIYQTGLDPEDKEPYTATVIAESWPTLERGALKDFKLLLNQSRYLRYLLKNPELEKGPFKFTNGSVLEFVTVRDHRDARHGKRHILFCNEVNNLDKKAVEQMMVRTKFRVYMDYNSDARFWVHDEYISRPDTDFFISNFTHNPFCPEKIKTQILGWKTDWEKTITPVNPKGSASKRNNWYVYGLGKTGVPEGAIYDDVNWVPMLPPHLKFRAYFLDWGFQVDPLAFGVAGVHAGELYGKELIYELGLLTTDLIKKFNELGIDKNDPIIVDNSDPESIAQLKKKGYNIVVFTDKKDKKSAIKSLRSRKINLTYDSANWASEQENYKWKKVRGEWTNEPQDGDDHLWDGFLYYYKYFFGAKAMSQSSFKKRTINRVR